MASFFNSRLSVFKLADSSSALRNLSPYIVSVSGLPGPRELNDVTALGDVSHKWAPSLENAVIGLELLYSKDATSGPEIVIGGIRASTVSKSFEYYPTGATTAASPPNYKYSGKCWVRNFEIEARVGNQILARAELPVSSSVARAAI